MIRAHGRVRLALPGPLAVTAHGRRGLATDSEAGWDNAKKRGKREGGRRRGGGRSEKRAGHAPQRVVCGAEQRTDKQVQESEVGAQKHAHQRQGRGGETGTFTTTTAQRLAPTAPNSTVGAQGLTRLVCTCTQQSGSHARDDPPTRQQPSEMEVTAHALTRTPWRRHQDKRQQCRRGDDHQCLLQGDNVQSGQHRKVSTPQTPRRQGHDILHHTHHR